MEPLSNRTARLRWIARAAVFAIVLAQLAYVRATFPSVEDYVPGADEGTYFHQGSSVADGGLPAFRTLAREFLADPRIQSSPPPTRIGHVLLAAAALRFQRSFRALSTLSLCAFAALCAVVFGFVRRSWGEPAALAAALLVASDPLGAGLARRALSDAGHALFLALSVFLLFEWIARPRGRTFAAFVVALTWTAILKEATLFLLPAFVVVLVYVRVRGIGDVRVRHFLLLAAVPAATAAVEAAVFGPGQAAALVTTVQRMNTLDASRYLRDYHAGPWFTSLVGMLLLSPLTAIVFMVSCGWWLPRLRSAPPTAVLIVWIAGAFACLALLPQNPRYAGPLDAFTRTLVAITVVTVAASSTRRARAALAAVAVLALAAVDVASFRRLFVEDGIYDPTAYQLVAARRLIPGGAPGRRPLTAGDYVDLSAAYYRAGDFPSAAATAERAVALQPGDPRAYNDLGAAYCELGRWREAIAALEVSLALQPDFALARNNLAWARAGLAKQGG